MALEMKKRPFKLDGSTYKIKIPCKAGENPKSTYITVNDDPESGEPFEIFLNGSDASVHEHLSTITIFVSGQMQIIGMDVQTIIDKLKGIHSPLGSHTIPGHGMSPSLAASVGYIIEIHMDSKKKD
ncbi:MAG: hypothetical protein KZQ70_09930 [gamma proteobacterium symbiont of Lucinoma myriamae]|nr:hypothetical protein [gamma proteobacterium symbiont of Lucinoma myriamae]MCU7819755.1 hypothetical protein [gamma proteobacterium symbiont of Lucinoma myriamae]